MTQSHRFSSLPQTSDPLARRQVLFRGMRHCVHVPVEDDDLRQSKILANNFRASDYGCLWCWSTFIKRMLLSLTFVLISLRLSCCRLRLVSVFFLFLFNFCENRSRRINGRRNGRDPCDYLFNENDKDYDLMTVIKSVDLYMCFLLALCFHFQNVFFSNSLFPASHRDFHPLNAWQSFIALPKPLSVICFAVADKSSKRNESKKTIEWKQKIKMTIDFLVHFSSCAHFHTRRHTHRNLAHPHQYHYTICHVLCHVSAEF